MSFVSRAGTSPYPVFFSHDHGIHEGVSSLLQSHLLPPTSKVIPFQHARRDTYCITVSPEHCVTVQKLRYS